MADHPDGAGAGDGDELRQPNLGQIVGVAGIVVVAVVGAALLTGLLPPDVRAVVYDTPLAIAVLIVVTGLVLWRVSRGTRSDQRPDS